jgi:hypothetical protein
MRIVVNYRTTNPGLPAILTKWTKVSFTYIIVSRSFSGAYSDIWATVAEVQGTQLAGANAAAVPVDLISFPFTKGAVAQPTQCSAYHDSAVSPNNGFNFATTGSGTTCSSAVIANPPTNVIGGRLIVHAYIMGFGFDPARTDTRFLAASAFAQPFAPFTGGAVGAFPDGS